MLIICVECRVNYSRLFSVIPVSHRPLLRYTVLAAALKRQCCVALKLGVKRLGCCYSCPTRLRLVCRAAQAADRLIGDHTEVLWRNSKSCLQFCLMLPPEIQNEYPFSSQEIQGQIHTKTVSRHRCRDCPWKTCMRARSKMLNKMTWQLWVSLCSRCVFSLLKTSA